MPKFNVTVEFDLVTEIEPEVSRYAFDSSGVEDYEDSSYWQGGEIVSSGGSLTFTVEAESDSDAEEAASEVISEGMEVEDGNGITWLTQSVSIEVEEVEIPMDAERAKLLVSDYIDSMDGMDDELRLAFQFLLELVTVQATEIGQLTRRVGQLAGELDRATNGPDGSEAVAV